MTEQEVLIVKLLLDQISARMQDLLYQADMWAQYIKEIKEQIEKARRSDDISNYIMR